MGIGPNFICDLINLLIIVVFVAAILTWFPSNPGTGFYQITKFFRMITDPIYRPLRRIIPPIGSGSVRMDITPLIVIIGLELISRLVC
jgi:uncharacterized protein YggT (Ycf19 family)